MCLETGCTIPNGGCGCWGCSQNCCKCNYNCFKCSNIKNLIKSNWIYYEETYPFSDVRNKFVCFSCRRVWKSSISKYICNAANVTPEEIIPIYCKNGMSHKKLINNIIHTYRNKTSKCAKCKNDGQYVGRNFKHCKNEKLWKKLEQDVKAGKVDLVKNFYEYPREIATLTKCLLQNIKTD